MYKGTEVEAKLEDEIISSTINVGIFRRICKGSYENSLVVSNLMIHNKNI